MAVHEADVPGWGFRAAVWAAQTAVASFLLFMGVAIAGSARQEEPMAVLGICAMVVGPILLLRQTAIMIDERIAAAE